MFGKNEIVGKKFFDLAGERLFITSMFYTLQGEGPLRGEPAFFIRFAKCNLACSFCDTYFDDGDWMTLDQIDKEIQETLFNHFKGNIPVWADCSEPTKINYAGQEHIHQFKREMALIITGGEPSLQKNILPFLQRMEHQFTKTQIESNGILYTEIPDSTILVVSPKCIEKDGKPTRYTQPNEKVMNRANCLKFVMSSEYNSPYNTIPDWARLWHIDTGKPIFVSPMNIYNEEPQRAIEAKRFKNKLSLEERSDVNEKISFWTPGLINLEQVQRNHEYTAEFCVRNGYVFNMQLHLFAGLA